MVRAGEQGNFLEDVLERIADNQEHAARMRSQVIGALVYPMILLVVGLGVVVVALTVLVPKFEGFLANGNALPPSTQLLLSASATIRTDWPWLLAALAAAGVTLFAFRHHPLLLRLRAEGPLCIPVASGVVRAAVTARFARAFGTLLDNGIGLLRPWPSVEMRPATRGWGQRWASPWNGSRKVGRWCRRWRIQDSWIQTPWRS